MADTHIHEVRETGDGGGMTAVVVTILIIAIVALAFWFGFRGRMGNGGAEPNTVNVELNTPGGASGAQ